MVTTVTLPPGLALRPWDLSQVRSATSWVPPASSTAIFWPRRSAGVLIAYFVMKKAPPELAPEMILTPPLVATEAATAELGPR